MEGQNLMLMLLTNIMQMHKRNPSFTQMAKEISRTRACHGTTGGLETGSCVSHILVRALSSSSTTVCGQLLIHMWMSATNMRTDNQRRLYCTLQADIAILVLYCQGNDY